MKTVTLGSTGIVTPQNAFGGLPIQRISEEEAVSLLRKAYDGGKTFFTQFGNDHLEVEKGTEIIVKANDVFGDPFTFYVNGNAVTPDENGYVRILVNDFILIGALGIPVVAPDAEESLNFIQKFIKAIKDFFAKIAAFFKF